MRLRSGMNRKKNLAVWVGVLCVMLVRPGTAQEPEALDEVARIRQMNTLDAVEKRDIRDPFWPVGFYPDWWRQPVSAGGKTAGEAAKPDQWAAALKQVKISGMSRMGNSGYFAVVNGRTVTEGDAVSVTLEGKTYRWSVVEIGEKGMKLIPAPE